MKFIRKNGRIIPIRDGQAPKKPVAVPANKAADEHFSKAKKALYLAAGATAGAFALSRLAAKLSLAKSFADSIDHTASVVDFAQLAKKASPFTLHTSENALAMADLVKRKVTLHPFIKEPALAHEFGHLAALSQKAGFNKLHAAMVGPHIKSLEAGQKTTGKNIFKFIVAQGARPFTNLGMEAEATAHALKEIKRVRGWQGVKESVAPLGIGYASYAAGAVAEGAKYNALYHYVKGRKARKKAEKKS